MKASAISPAASRKFADSLKGEIILPDDNRYEQARRVWNHAVDRRPAIIARCANSEDVVRALEFAHTNNLLVAIRSGGHSFAGHGVCDGGMVIDTALMNRVQVDPAADRISLGGYPG